MIDITGKSPSLRESEAIAIIKVSKLDTISIIKEDKVPLKSVEQLKLILPKKSFGLIPDVEKYPDYYYPDSFKVNYIMKRYSWEGHPILPEIII